MTVYSPKFYRTKVTFYVLSEQSIEDVTLSLMDLHDLTDEDGDCVGYFGESEQQELSPKQAANALKKAGSEPGFFNLDDDGNYLDD